MKTTFAVLVAAGVGVGAWALYKKYNPECAQNMQNKVKSMSKNVAKNVEDMM